MTVGHHVDIAQPAILASLSCSINMQLRHCKRGEPPKALHEGGQRDKMSSCQLHNAAQMQRSRQKGMLTF